MIEILTPSDWRGMAESAHLVTFGTYRPSEMDSSDGVLLFVEDLIPKGWITFKIMDRDTVYWQYGGTFPEARGFKTLKMYEEAIKRTKSTDFKRITTKIENDNVAMLKLALHAGFRVIGVSVAQGAVLCELRLEFE